MHDPREIAKQLRLPEGENAKIATDFMARGNQMLYDVTLQKLNLFDGARVLEIGPANGHFVENVFQKNDSVFYTGVDLSADMIAEAKKINSELLAAKKAEFIYGNIIDLPLTNNQFDFVFTINTLYFWPDVQKGMSEILRVLKKGGKLVVAIRSKETMMKMPFTEFGFTLYSKDDLKNLFVANNLSEIMIFSDSEEITLPNGEKKSLENHWGVGML